MDITTEQIKALRDKTGISIMQCRKALEEARGDIEKAQAFLRKKGAEMASKKLDGVLGAGVVVSYIHSNDTLGTLVELLSETDFVSRSDDFRILAKDIAMQVAAGKPEFLKKEEVTIEAKKTALEIFEKEVEGKPANLREKILEGKVDAYFKERILLEQNFIKNPDLTVGKLIEAAVQKFGEKVEIGRFALFQVGSK